MSAPAASAAASVSSPPPPSATGVRSQVTACAPTKQDLSAQWWAGVFCGCAQRVWCAVGVRSGCGAQWVCAAGSGWASGGVSSGRPCGHGARATPPKLKTAPNALPQVTQAPLLQSRKVNGVTRGSISDGRQGSISDGRRPRKAPALEVKKPAAAHYCTTTHHRYRPLGSSVVLVLVPVGSQAVGSVPYLHPVRAPLRQQAAGEGRRVSRTPLPRQARPPGA
jgi:hypothetical protein